MIACCVEENEVNMNVEQLQVYEEVFRSVNNEHGRIYFLDAPRGTEVHGAKWLKVLFQVIKELIGIHSMHIVWNVRFEAVGLKKEEKRECWMNGIPTKGERGTLDTRVENRCFR